MLRKGTVMLPIVFAIVLANVAFGTISCAAHPADATASATAALSVPREPRPADQADVLLVLAASASGSTARVAKAMADKLGAVVVGTDRGDALHSDDFRLVGFGSGIFNGEHHAALRDKLRAKGYEIVGEFGCPGFNDNKFLKLIGGLNRGRPNADDLERARSFARQLVEFSEAGR